MNLSGNEALDVLQPSHVLLLLLVVNVVWDEESKLSVDSTLIQVALEEDLEVLVEVAEWWSGIDATALPVGLGGLGVGESGGLVVVDVVNHEHTVLGDSVNLESSGVGLRWGLLDSVWG